MKGLAPKYIFDAVIERYMEMAGIVGGGREYFEPASSKQFKVSVPTSASAAEFRADVEKCAKSALLGLSPELLRKVRQGKVEMPVPNEYQVVLYDVFTLRYKRGLRNNQAIEISGVQKKDFENHINAIRTRVGREFLKRKRIIRRQWIEEKVQLLEREDLEFRAKMAREFKTAGLI